MTAELDTRTSLAFGRDAVVAVGPQALFSEEGVALALDRGEDHVVIVFPVSFEPVAPKPGPEAPAFDTSEHVITVWGLLIQTEQGQQLAQSYALPLAPPATFALAYGQVIALGGDFYGNPEKPICKSAEPVRQFSENFEQLAKAKPEEVAKILAVANKFEFVPIERLPPNYEPSGVYAAMTTTPPHWVSDEDRAFDEATGGTQIKNGRYLELAKTNFDHFGLDAVTAYEAGHQLAQEAAVAAKSIVDPHVRAQMLARAYAINAFADHFLTDLFAAGHMRTPRRALYESAWNPVTADGASLCAKQMHDEDNKFGLWVENNVGDKWVAYGDARYRDLWNAAGRVVLRKAVQQSMNDIWSAFSTKQIKDAKEVLKYVAKVVWRIGEPAQREDPANWAPLFWQNPADKNIWRREELFDPSNRKWLEQGNFSGWGITTTVERLVLAKFPVYMPRWAYPTNVPFPPEEKGMTGEYGWPPQPGGMSGPFGATGPTIRAGLTGWFIARPPGPTQPPGPTGVGEPAGEEQPTGAGEQTGADEPAGAGEHTGTDEPATVEETTAASDESQGVSR